MKIIDKTPLQDADGNINIISRIRGTLKYGFSWFGEMEAQKTVIAQLSRSLEKGFVLIRNFTLPKSEIVIPMILIGAGGIWVIYVTKVSGHFEAKGDQWNIISDDGKSLPASVNLISRASKLTGAFQKYLKIQKIEMSNPVESILIAIDPGAQVDSLRPVVRVVRADAVKQLASSFLQARPIWRTDYIHELSNLIVDSGQLVESETPINPIPDASQQQPISRAKAIFKASEQTSPMDMKDFGFAMEEDGFQPIPQNVPEPKQARSIQNPAAGKKKLFGLSNIQLIVLAGMFIFWCCILIGAGAFIYLNS